MNLGGVNLEEEKVSSQNRGEQLARLQQLYKQGVLPEELYCAALVGPGEEPDKVAAHIGIRQEVAQIQDQGRVIGLPSQARRCAGWVAPFSPD